MDIEDLKWRKFEKLTAKIAESLHPNAHVEHDVHIEGKSGVKRQVDVVVWDSPAKQRLLLFIDCKDYEPSRGNIGIGTVDEFIGTVTDFDVHSAALVTFSDFTEDAKKRAVAAGIKLWRAADTGDHEWQADLSIPILTRSLSMKSASFAFVQNSPGPFQMQLVQDMRELPLYSRNKQKIGTTGSLLLKAWNNGKLPQSVGSHERISFIDEPTMVMGGDNQHYFVSILVNPTVEQTCHLIKLGIKELSGFYDLHSGGMITNGFTTKALDTRTLDQDGIVITDPQDLAIKPFIEIEFIDTFVLEK